MPKISVVVPIYNVAAYLPACLESLQRQSHSDFDVVLVNDESTDCSASIAERLTETDSRFRLVHQANRGPGPGGGRNGGLNSANGDRIMFIDSDDVLPPDSLRLLDDSLDRQGAEIATGQVRRLSGSMMGPSRLHDRSHQAVDFASSLAASPNLVFDPTAWNKLYRREFFNHAVKQFPEKVLYEDMYPSMCAYTRATKIAIISDPVYVWRSRQDGSSITQQHENWRGQLDRLSELLRVDALLAAQPDAVRQRHTWRAVNMDLAYSVERLGAMTPTAAAELFEAVRVFLVSLDEGMRTWRITPPARAAVDFILARDLHGLQAMVRAQREPPRACRRSVDDPRVRSKRLGAQLLRSSIHGDVIRLRISTDVPVNDLTVTLTSPPPLAGAAVLSATVAGTPARLGHRVDIPVSLLSAEGGGEFHFLVQGTDRAGTVLDSELERSLADRLLSRVARNDSVVTQGESFQLFFEDARLHAHRCSHDDVVGATVTASDRSIDLELSGSNLTPKALVLAHRPDLLDPIEATLEDVDGGRASATIDIDRLCHGIVSEHAWHFSWITDPDDPLPKPITLVEPAQTVAAGFGSRLHIVNTARSQLTVLVMPRIDRQAAERARSVLRTGRIPGVRQIKGHAK